MGNSIVCSSRAPFISRHINEILDEGLGDIRETLHQDADFVKAPTLSSYRGYGIGGIERVDLYPGSNKAMQLDSFLYDINFGSGSRGNYHPESGRIFFKEGRWCRKTLIHETLHSVSIFAYDQNIKIGTIYPFLREGLTEFLTGYVLWQNYRQCHEAWKAKIYPQLCDLAYKDMIRIWYTFCRFVDFEAIKKLYFGNGSNVWRKVWGEFIQSVNDAGYVFQDPLIGRGDLQDRFVDQCRRAFGRYEFDKILEMESLDLDYGLIVSKKT